MTVIDNAVEAQTSAHKRTVVQVPGRSLAIFDPLKVVYASPLELRSIDVGDLDGDGFPDVAVAFQLSDHVVWFRNADGQGGFTTGTDIDTDAGGSPSNVKLADVDGDGDLDVVSAWKTGDRVTWYENDGEGTFAIGLDLSTTADGAYGLALADLDGDDDLDVVSASVWDGLAWYENSDGNGVFSFGISLERGEPAKDVVTADLDGDGDLDIIAASYDGSHASSNYYDGRIFWIENTDGEGTFGEGEDIDSLDSARIVVPVDLDNDGDVDLVACDNVGGRVMWYENTNGQGNFSAAIDIAIDSGVNMVIAVDLDGDDDFDLLTASRDSGRVIWYENLLAEDGDSGATSTTPAPLPILAPTPSMAPTLATSAPPSSRASPVTGTTSPSAPVEAELTSAPVEAEAGADTGSSDGNSGISATLEIFIGVASTVASAVILGAAKIIFSRRQPADAA
ncbi:conserved unknown protein [Ectocarpus siliculosus]|uniref:VCBS repeat-containing protein n=1 Tax=Ectocarpus siliculosus TaxID=2880 RepID=D8LE48_ECTSI|nr:conserved unknown protein [Ectocarpus siliculosus]|eukprot:CBN74120.1 conserved unknown protein [Ectocarpus siliculosus]